MSFEQLHPFFVHFPIALICLVGIIELLRLFTNKIPSFISLIILFLSTIMSFLAVQSGELARRSISSKKLLKIIEEHEMFGDIVMWYSIILLIVWLYLFLKKLDNKILKLFLIFILIALVIKTAFLGGELVHIHHIYSR